MTLIDVDFRYVMRDSYQNEITGECFFRPRKVKVLQWRKCAMTLYVGHENSDGSYTPSSERVKWTEWQDVRIDGE